MSGNHPTKSCHCPAPHMIVLTAYRNKILFAEFDFSDRTAVHSKSLKQLRSVSDGFRMLNNYSNHP
jgi:hypothetical protein